MVDGESDSKTKDHVNQTINGAQTTTLSVDQTLANLQQIKNNTNQLPSNSQIPGQFNYFHQQYRQIPEDAIDNVAQSPSAQKSQLATVYKSTAPTLSIVDSDGSGDAKHKYALAKLNGNGSCSSDCSEKFSNATPNSITKADFEQAIELTGYGKFHVSNESSYIFKKNIKVIFNCFPFQYILLAICGLVSTSEEMDVISMSFILPSAQCDLDLNTQTKGWLNSIIFIGMMVGAYVWGSIADTVGRRKVLIVISFMNAICIVASSFCQTYALFMIFRFLNGVALGGSGPVIWSYFAEFQPKSRRGSMLSFMAAFWTIGNLFVAGLAWLVIPSGKYFK